MRLLLFSYCSRRSLPYNTRRFYAYNTHAYSEWSETKWVPDPVAGFGKGLQKVKRRSLPIRLPMVFCTWLKVMKPQRSLSRWFTAAASVVNCLLHVRRLGQWYRFCWSERQRVHAWPLWLDCAPRTDVASGDADADGGA